MQVGGRNQEMVFAVVHIGRSNPLHLLPSCNIICYMKKDQNQNNQFFGDHFSHHSFDDPEAFSKRFDAPERDEWQKPDRVIEAFQLSDDATVAEIGAGTGYFVVRLAKHLKRGKVIALDEEPKMVDFLKKRIQQLGLTNVEVRLSRRGDPDNWMEKLDLILCVDAYHHIADRISYFSNYHRYLKGNGKLVIIDRVASSRVVPPAHLRISTELVKQELKEAGFVPVQEMDFLLPDQFYIAFAPINANFVP